KAPPTLQKSPPTPRYGLTPFCRNDRHYRRSPPPSVFSFRLQSLPYRYGVVFLPLPPQDEASLTPSPTSARCDPSTTPNNQRSACSLAWSLLVSRQPMTNYSLKPPPDPPTLPAWQQAKEKRKQQLA